jgi:branched-chain amino acid transport system permease protein
MELGYLFGTIVKMVALVAWIYGLLWGLARPKKWQKGLTIVIAFAVIQVIILSSVGGLALFSAFDQGLLFQAITMTMVALGLNLIYGFNGQFSLAQWGFYGIGAYCAADITYRWANGDSSGLVVGGLGVLLGAAAIFGVGAFLKRKRGVPVLSAFTFYLIAIVAAGFIAVKVGAPLAASLNASFGTAEAPGALASPIAMQAAFFLAVVIAGAFAAEVSFIFGLPVLSLGSDYFGIATLGFAIIVKTLLVNSDTILPFPEMKGGRGMIGIPKLLPFSNPAGEAGSGFNVALGAWTPAWLWIFLFFVLVLVLIRNFVRSSTGRATLAVREDEIAARAMGVDVAKNKLLVFVAGSFLAGIGGGIYAHYMGFLSPGSFDFIQGFNPLIVVVFGGLGSMTGSIVASFGWIFFLEGLLRVLLGQLGTDAPSWRFVLYPIALLLLMLVRPKGLLGTVEWGFLKARGAAEHGAPPRGAPSGGGGTAGALEGTSPGAAKAEED